MYLYMNLQIEIQKIYKNFKLGKIKNVAGLDVKFENPKNLL